VEASSRMDLRIKTLRSCQPCEEAISVIQCAASHDRVYQMRTPESRGWEMGRDRQPKCVTDACLGSSQFAIDSQIRTQPMPYPAKDTAQRLQQHPTSLSSQHLPASSSTTKDDDPKRIILKTCIGFKVSQINKLCTP
jgi:hypothetical protein